MHDLELWLRQQRAAGEKITRRQLAAEVDCSPAWITEIIQGKGLPSLKLSARLSRRTGIPIEKFVGES